MYLLFRKQATVDSSRRQAECPWHLGRWPQTEYMPCVRCLSPRRRNKSRASKSNSSFLTWRSTLSETESQLVLQIQNLITSARGRPPPCKSAHLARPGLTQGTFESVQVSFLSPRLTPATLTRWKAYSCSVSIH